MLLTAFGMYRARHPESNLKLVCTGGLSARREELRAAGARMGMNGQLLLTAYLPNEEFAVLLRTCRAMIFPSLFEGFGMPVLEATWLLTKPGALQQCDKLARAGCR